MQSTTANIKQEQERISKKYDLPIGHLQMQWREGTRNRLDELEDAIIDALAQGSVYAWPGDGVACVKQIILMQIERAEYAEMQVERLEKRIGELEEDYQAHYWEGFSEGQEQALNPLR